MSEEKKKKLEQGDILKTIARVDYILHKNTTLTICIITLKNGFCVTGESAAIHVDTFDRLIGEKLAYDTALEKIWMLESYILKNELSNNEK